MKYNIVQFDRTMLHLLPHPQQPFDIIGRLVPTYDGTDWRTAEQLLSQKKETTYPDDSFDPIEYIENTEQSAFLAMLNTECVGSIRVCKRWNGNAFIDDLAIDRAHRGHGVGRMLMDAAVQWGKDKGLNGVSLETQDWNLLACRFYLKYGFKLGGIDTKVYTHSLYKGKTALYFYLTLDK
ncbi:GNAT family N-acetyltransferase [Anaerocolumna sp. MB42-C2]|uniref:GNAT family N-acetyltransferase n=1 Tax=Anaerocolumna sp. MB42-C2 TaxID=3070997 RepID=UPI0027DF8A86|nr:GNAT family N-acetyltransferase [Anaerocolumna sp. MB42-C2]WMJ86303.1 GNAT family N-acetyltransferase [Anaerocolumna sp. MB42-C2]